jgi:myosin heavy subunit
MALKQNPEFIQFMTDARTGLCATLDATNRMPQGSPEIFVENLLDQHKHSSVVAHAQSQRYGGGSKLEFRVEHFAGPVVYDASEFVRKNANARHPDTVVMLGTSLNSFVKETLAVGNAAGGQEKKLKTAFQSIADLFVRQLNQLLTLLKRGDASFVRCLNPNQIKVAFL